MPLLPVTTLAIQHQNEGVIFDMVRQMILATLQAARPRSLSLTSDHNISKAANTRRHPLTWTKMSAASWNQKSVLLPLVNQVKAASHLTANAEAKNQSDLPSTPAHHPFPAQPPTRNSTSTSQAVLSSAAPLAPGVPACPAQTPSVATPTPPAPRPTLKPLAHQQRL